jgi:hypothetical protein
MIFKHIFGCITVTIGLFSIVGHADTLSLEKVSSYETEGKARSIEIVGDYAYISEDSKGLNILDIKNVDNPKKVSSYAWKSGHLYDVVIDNNIAYLAYNKKGMIILDISDPLHPIFHSRYNTPGRTMSIAIKDGYAYLADRNNGLLVMDVTDLDNPKKVSQYKTGSNILDVVVENQYVYLADTKKGVVILDISDPTQPQKVSEISVHAHARAVVYHDGYLYVADQDKGVDIIDVHDVYNPTMVATFSTGGKAINLNLNGNYLYVADYLNGVSVLDISNKNNPLKISNVTTNDKVRNVCISNEFIFAANGNSGLSIFKAHKEIEEDTTVGKVQNQDVRMARMVQEYHLVNNLVSHGIVNETIDSGDWSDPLTWKDGKIPQDGARVLINSNHKVTINEVLTTKIRTIKLKGELAFNPYKNTQLVLDTMVTNSGSILRIGEPRIPVDNDKVATIVIHDYLEEGMITDDSQSMDYDPLRIGQGILTNGLFFAHGAYKTPYVEISGKGIAKGSMSITFDEDVEGWKVGDNIVVLGTSESGTQSEYRTIVALNERELTFDKALEYDHFVPDTTIEDLELKVHIANVTRNIVIKTDSDVIKDKGIQNDLSNVEHRGHVLFMHNNNVNINSVQFKDLGRTNKKYVLNETTFTSASADAEVKKVGTNQAARYPVHFHRAGIDGKIGRINDCVVIGSPGWGYVNHSSNVIMKDNIAYGVYGAAFITEAGDENGKFVTNMAIETHGYGRSSVKGWKQRRDEDDWGFGGNGFWLLGPNVDVVDNIVNGSSNSAFAFTRVTIDSVTGVIKSENNIELPYKKVALKSFVGNIAYANSGGVFGILSGTRDGTTEKISGLVAYANMPLSYSKNNPNDAELISWWYPSNILLEDVTLIGDIHDPKYTGIGTQTKLRKTIIKNARIEGMNIGIRIPEYVGENIVEDGYYNNLTNMLYYLGTTNKGANTVIQGNIVYGDLPGDFQQNKLKFGLKVRDVDYKNYRRRQFNRYNIIYAIDGEDPLKLYATKQQASEYVIDIGDHKGKTNQQLVDEGKNPVGGVILPEDAFSVEGMINVSATSVQ